MTLTRTEAFNRTIEMVEAAVGVPIEYGKEDVSVDDAEFVLVCFGAAITGTKPDWKVKLSLSFFSKLEFMNKIDDLLEVSGLDISFERNSARVDFEWEVTFP